MSVDQCQRCGAFIGLIGRMFQLFGPLAPHRCKRGAGYRTAGHEAALSGELKPKEISMSDDFGSLPATPSVPTMLERMAMAMCLEIAGVREPDPGDYQDAARAALLAIREPSEVMTEHGEGALAHDVAAAQCFRAMIDAILNGDA